jgi:hypothetical protein
LFSLFRICVLDSLLYSTHVFASAWPIHQHTVTLSSEYHAYKRGIHLIQCKKLKGYKEREGK